jgi:hypothetical protein
MNLLKRFALYLFIILGLIYGYQYITGKSLTTLPRELYNKLQQKDTRTESANPKYYSDPSKYIPKE